MKLCQYTVLIVVMTCSLFAVADNAQPPISQLHVRGEAQLMVSPDQVSLSLGVSTESEKAKKAMEANTKKMRAVITALEKLGIGERDYKTQNFRVQPVWSSRPKGAGSSWKAKIVGYRVNNTLHVTTQKLTLIGDIIGVTTAAGANHVNSVNFSLSNPRQYRSQAITQAMQNAKADAEILVAASGDKIKRTLSLHLDNASASKVRVETASVAKSRSLMAAQDSFSPPPISSGDITVRASVSVTYELEK